MNRREEKIRSLSELFWEKNNQIIRVIRTWDKRLNGIPWDIVAGVVWVNMVWEGDFLYHSTLPSSSSHHHQHHHHHHHYRQPLLLGHLGQSSMRRGLPTCVTSPIGWNTVKCNPIVMMYCNVIVCNIICNIICLPLVESVTLYARVSIHCAPIQFTAIICAMLQCCGHCGFVQYDLYYRMCNRKTMLGSASCPQAAHWGSCPG